MGYIEDEYDVKQSTINQIDENNFIVKGSLNVNDFNTIFNTSIELGEYDTLNGYLLTQFGKIPSEGNEITINNINFLVDKMKNRRIEDIKVTLK